MDQETLKRAKLLTALLCRAIDYHAVTTASTDKSKGSDKSREEAREQAEAGVRVAMENAMDGGAFE